MIVNSLLKSLLNASSSFSQCIGGGAVGGGPGGPRELSLRPVAADPPSVELDLAESPPLLNPELDDNPESDQLLCSFADHL